MRCQAILILMVIMPIYVCDWIPSTGVFGQPINIAIQAGNIGIDNKSSGGVTVASSEGFVFPGTTWEFKTPAEAGLDAAKLNDFQTYVGGRGCIVRHGYMVHTWGNQSQRQDVASACKPVFAHFLLKAVEDGKLGSLDEPVVNWEPGLNNINAALGYKDRNITFRHLVNQISCYGVREDPGTAFDYNDYQTSLFFDTLMLKVYGATSWATIDAQILHPKLTDIIQCQDNPTFMAFGTGDRPGRLGISVRDFARFGLLYLRRGNWAGRQLISQANATMAVTSPLSNSIPRTAGEDAEMCPGQRSHGGKKNQTDHWGSYSYMWWTNGVNRDGNRIWPDAPLDTYGAFGHRGPRAVWVVPSLDIVVSYNDTNLTDDLDRSKTNHAMKLLVEAVVKTCNNDDPPEIPEGSIIVDPRHPAWLRYKGGGPMFMCGPGDPEGFLYRGTRNPDGTRNGDQMTLINKLIGTGANCIYLMGIRSHGGDGGPTENPFVDSDINNPLDQDILNQWETWFTAMDDKGIVIYFFFYDDAARPFGRQLPAGGELDPREANYVDTIVSRFKHHKHLIWCVAEEYSEGFTQAHAEKVAERIKLMDHNQHPVANHQINGTSFDFKSRPNFDQFAVQWNVRTVAELHSGTLAAWNDVGGQVNINMSEFKNSGTGAELRKKIWAIALAGGYSMILNMDIASTPISDLQACGRLVQFMQATRFNETSPHDDLARGDTDYVLADPGNVYIAYGDSDSSLGLSIIAANYRIKWYEPVDGDWIDEGVRTVPGGTQTFAKPDGIGDEAVLYLEFPGEAPAVPGNFDGDNDVDLNDFGYFQACLSGNGVHPQQGCENADFNNDSDVDEDDFIIFLLCMSGPNIPADPNCAQ